MSGTGRIFKRGNIYWIDYGHRGNRHRESSKSHRKKDAVALLRKRQAEMQTGKVTGPDAERVMYEDLETMILDDYTVNKRKSIRRLRTSLKHLRRYFGQYRAVDITTDRVKRYVRERQENDEVANATIMKELAALKRAFTLAVQAGRLPRKPYVPSLQLDNVREGFFSDMELRAIVKHLPEPLQAVVRFAAFTGWRKSEVLGLQWAHVDFEAGEVRLWKSKNSEPRVFPFRVLPPLTELLETQRQVTRTLERQEQRIIPHVFHREGAPIKDMRGSWDNACKLAGVPGAWMHDLRRTAVRNLERAGVSRSVATKLTGHKTEAVYRRYAIADSVALDEGVAKLAELHKTG